MLQHETCPAEADDDPNHVARTVRRPNRLTSDPTWAVICSHRRTSPPWQAQELVRMAHLNRGPRQPACHLLVHFAILSRTSSTIVEVDLIFLEAARDSHPHNVIDHCTKLQLCGRLPGRTVRETWKSFSRGWPSYFGPRL